MAISKYLKENLKEDKVHLFNALSYLKRNLAYFKAEGISEWESFRNKFDDDMDKIEKSSKKKNFMYRK
jgi:hypothetical protein